MVSHWAHRFAFPKSNSKYWPRPFALKVAPGVKSIDRPWLPGEWVLCFSYATAAATALIAVVQAWSTVAFAVPPL